MKRWPFIVFVCNILLNQCILGVPIAQLSYSQLPQLPSFINYIGNTALSGGTQASLLNPNFSAGQVVTSSGIPTNPIDSGTAAGMDLLGEGIVQAGRGLGSSVSTLLGCEFYILF